MPWQSIEPWQSRKSFVLQVFTAANKVIYLEASLGAKQFNEYQVSFNARNLYFFDGGNGLARVSQLKRETLAAAVVFLQVRFRFCQCLGANHGKAGIGFFILFLPRDIVAALFKKARFIVKSDGK